MKFKPKIKQILTHIPLFIIALVCALSINSIQAYALDAGLEAEIVSGVKANLIGVSNSGHTTTGIPEGVSWANTGYLCYMYTKEGSPVPGTQAVLLKCSTFVEKPGNTIKVISKNGEFTKTQFDKTCPWPYTPFNEDKSSNQAQIKEWMVQKVDGVQNGVDFVDKTWTQPGVAEKFIAGDYVLVVENVLHFQYSKEADGASSEPPKAQIKDVREMLKKIVGLNEYNRMLREDKQAVGDAIAKLAEKINEEIAAEWDSIAATTGYQLLGSPVTGTCSDLLDYFNQYIKQHTSVNLFSRYTRNISCFAEMLEENETGFTIYTGATHKDIRLSDDVIKSKGVSMFILSASSDSINTYSPPEGSPGPAENPGDNPTKQGNCTIVKGYYTEDELTQTKISDGVYTQPNTTNKINIMEEPEYQLVSWNISTSEPTTPDPAGAWISTPKGGIEPTTVTLETNEKTLYVLLKKVEEAELEVDNELWVLEESEITAQVSTANKAASNGTDLKITVTLPTLEKCNGHYKEADPGHSEDCEETCTQSHKYGWTDYCTSWTLDDKSFSLITKNTNEDNTATSKNVLAKDSLTSRNILFRNQVKAYPAPVVNALFFCKSFRQKLHLSTCTKASFFSLK